MTRPSPNTVIAGGGAVGTMLADVFAGAGAEVVVVDLRPPDGPVRHRHLGGDVTCPSAAMAGLLAAADVVVLAVDENTATAAVPVVGRLARDDALLVETMSVKVPIGRAITGAGGSALGLNPMFAPALGLPGRPVAAVRHGTPPSAAAASVLGMIEAAGGVATALNAEQHDRIAAATQVLTHAAVLSFGAALGRLGVDPAALAALAPPPHRMLLALLARIAGGTPAVYRDIQHANPYAAEARAALAGAVGELDAVGATGDPAAFDAFMRGAGAALGDDLTGYAALCSTLLAGLPPAG